MKADSVGAPVRDCCKYGGRRISSPAPFRPEVRRRGGICRHPGARPAGFAGAVRHFRRAVRQESARPLFLYVSGRVRHLVLLAEHADARRAAHSHRAVHGAAGAARHGDHRRRGRAVDRRAVRHQRGAWRCRRRRRWSSTSPWRSPAWSAAACGSCCPARCASIAASTKRFRACCSSISRSPFSTFWSKVRCATRPASTSRRRRRSAPPT